MWCLKGACSFSRLPLALLQGWQKHLPGEKQYNSAMAPSPPTHPQQEDADLLKLAQKHSLLSQTYGIFLILVSLNFR